MEWKTCSLETHFVVLLHMAFKKLSTQAEDAEKAVQNGAVVKDVRIVHLYTEKEFKQ